MQIILFQLKNNGGNTSSFQISLQVTKHYIDCTYRKFSSWEVCLQIHFSVWKMCSNRFHIITLRDGIVLSNCQICSLV